MYDDESNEYAGTHRDDSNGAWGRCILRDTHGDAFYPARHLATVEFGDAA